MAYDKEIKEKFIELRAKDTSYCKIEKELGVTRQTLMKWGKEFENEIEFLEFLESYSLIKQFKIDKCSRIEHLGQIIEKSRKALLNKDFEKLPVEKLVEIYFRHNDKFLDEIKNITCGSKEKVHEVEKKLENMGQVPAFELKLEI